MFKKLGDILNPSRKAKEQNGKREKVEKLILAHQRRLNALKAKQDQSGDGSLQMRPEAITEIEDIEGELQTLRHKLVNGADADKEKIEKGIAARKRRLEILQQIGPTESPAGRMQQEIKDIEAKIQGLKDQLRRL